MNMEALTQMFTPLGEELVRQAVAYITIYAYTAALCLLVLAGVLRTTRRHLLPRCDDGLDRVMLNSIYAVLQFLVAIYFIDEVIMNLIKVNVAPWMAVLERLS